MANYKDATAQKKRNSLLYLLFYLSVFTVSFDIFLVFKLGFNFRITQFLIMPVMLAVPFIAHGNREIRWPVAFTSLLLWLFFNIIFIPNTTFLLRSIGYTFWLTFDILVIFTTVQLFGSYEHVFRLVRCYLWSMFFVASFAIFQFFCALLLGWAPLLWTFMMPGVLPRANAFSYESSTFGTYMILGFVMSAYLVKKRSTIMPPRYLKVIYWTTLGAMIVSTSRMGWALLVLWYSQGAFVFIRQLFRGKVLKKHMRVGIVLLLAAMSAAFYMAYTERMPDLSLYVWGLGIFDTPAHSVLTRLHEAKDTLKIFRDSPFIGYSLGGISAAIGDLRGDYVNSLYLAKLNEGMSVFIEVLAASGIFGFIPFLHYIAMLMWKPFKLADRIPDPELKNILRAVATAFIFEIIVLQFCQTILRPYLWLHIAVLSAVYSAAASAITDRAPIETGATIPNQFCRKAV